MTDAALRTNEAPGRDATSGSAPWATLQRAAIVFTLAVLFHNADHARRGGDAVSAEVFWVGTAAVVLEVAIVASALRRHPVAPWLAAIGGFALAAGYLVVHFTPERSFFSDSFPDGEVDAISVLAGSVETLSALIVGAAGANMLRRLPQLDWRAPFDVRAAITHPLVAIFVAGNLAVVVLGLADRVA